MSFFSNVAASIVAALIMLALAGVLSAKARWVFTAVLGRLLDIDIEYVYRNGRGAAADVRSEIQRAKWVDLMTGRGGELQRETFAPLLGERVEGRQCPFRILLPIAEVADAYSWTDQRENELAEFDLSFGHGVLRTQIRTTVEFLRPHVKPGILELRLYNYPHIGRILITDRAPFFTPYRADAHGRDSRVIKFRAGGDIYEVLHRLFKQVWKVSDTVSAARVQEQNR